MPLNESRSFYTRDVEFFVRVQVHPWTDVNHHLRGFSTDIEYLVCKRLQNEVKQPSNVQSNTRLN